MNSFGSEKKWMAKGGNGEISSLASIDRYSKHRDILSRRDQALIMSRGIAGLLRKI